MKPAFYQAWSRTARKSLLLAALLALGGLFAAPRAIAQLIPSWVGGVSGDWSLPTNWSSVSVPGAANKAAISHGSAAVTLNTASTVAALTIGAGDTLTIANAQSLRIKKNDATDGFITNASTLVVNNTSGFNNTDLVVEGGEITLGGGGQVRLSNSGNNRIYGAASTDRLINQDNTVSGSGQIGLNLLGLVNRGTIVANQSTALTIDPSESGVINSGALRADGGTLRLSNGTITNFEGLANGTIEALGTSAVELNGAVVLGGNFSTAPGAAIRNIGSATLRGVTLLPGANFTALNNTVTTLIGTLTNAGTFSLTNTSGFNNTDILAAEGDVTISGGQIVLSNHGNNRFRGADPSSRFILDGTTLSGGGQLGVNSVGFVNRGTIVANQTSALTLDPSDAGFVNRGTLRAHGGSLKLTNGTFTNTESGSAGVIEALDSSFVDLNGATVVGGNLATSGSGLLRNLGSATLNGISFGSGAAFSALNNTVTTLVGTIHNAGTVSLNNTSGFNNTDLLVGGSATLSGGGNISFSNHANNRLRAQTPGDRLINENNTISGAGQIGTNTLKLTNRGTISATFGTALTVDTADLDNFNRGSLQGAAGGVLMLHDTTLTNAEDGAAGSIVANGGEVRITGGSHIAAGNVTVLGAGELQLNGSTVSLANITGSPDGIIRTTGGTSVLDRVNLSNPPGGQIILNNNSALQLNAGGTHVNAGTLRIDNTSGFNNTDLIVSGGDVSISGGGDIALSNHGNNRIRGIAASDRLVLEDMTLSGSGQVGLNAMGIVNRGTILANQSVPLTIDPSDSAGVINRGTLRADGGTLNLRNGTFTNSEGAIAGRIEANNGSKVDLDGTTIVGGVLRTSVGGQIRNVGSATLSNVSVDFGSSYVGANASATTLTGTISNAGNISLNNSSGFNTTDLVISGDVTLNGGGLVTLTNHGNNRIRSNDASVRLINLDNTIQGSGQLGLNSMGLLNQHVIVANQPVPLTIDPGDIVGVTNRGTLRAHGGTLTLSNGTFTNVDGGVVGQIEALDASFVDLNGATILGGNLATAGSGLVRNVGTAKLQDVTLAGASFSANNSSVTTLAGMLHNFGVLALNNTSGFNQTDLLVSGDVTLAGHGTVSLSNHGNNRIYGASGGEHLINDGNVIQGSGQLGLNRTRITNQGTILANQSAPLTVDPDGGGFTNRMLVRADNATLNLVGGTFTNAGEGFVGVMEAANNGHIDLNNATITGGILNAAVGSHIRNVGTATLDGVVLASGTSFFANNNTSTSLVGNIANGGTISLNNSSGFNNTDLVVAGSVTLGGNGGQLALSNHANNRVLGGGTLTNSHGHAIRGSGKLGLNQLSLVNHGAIEANQSIPLTVDLSNATPFNNQGILRAVNGGNLIIVDALSNAGLVGVHSASIVTAQGTFTQTAGAMAMHGGTFAAASAAFHGGAIAGTGTLNGPVTNAGVIAPGLAAAGNGAGIGLLTFNHALTLTPTSLLHLELGGTASFDRIQAQSAALDGALAVTFANGFEFSIQGSDTFTLLSTTQAAGLSGTFAALGQGTRFLTADGLGSFLVNYGPNSFFLTDFQAIPEPSTYALLGLGAVVLLVAARRRR